MADKDQFGHRARMRQKLSDKGAEALTDQELFEIILFAILPRIDTKPIVKSCFREFKTFAGILTANERELLKVQGLGTQTIQHIKCISALLDRISFDKIDNQNILANWQALQFYCIQKLAHHPIEALYVILLDNQNKVISMEQLGSGTINQMTVYPREVLKIALEKEAVSIVLVHNHPSGDKRASRHDIDMTARLQTTLKSAHITLHDHLIIAAGSCISMRNQGLIQT
ncbi:MAG: RadC family protein [Candidatus Puniceispirillaceae bacterium]